MAAECGTAEEAVALVRRRPFELAILDVLLPKTTGVSLATELIECRPETRILALSVLDEPVMMSAMRRAGASGYAIKTQPAAEIIRAARTVLGGGAYLPPHVSRDAVLASSRTAPDSPLERLTRREREITVETHRLRIMRELGASSLIDMIRVAAREGALPDVVARASVAIEPVRRKATRVTLTITLQDQQFAIAETSHTDPYVAVSAAFRTARRGLLDRAAASAPRRDRAPIVYADLELA